MYVSSESEEWAVYYGALLTGTLTQRAGEGVFRSAGAARARHHRERPYAEEGRREGRDPGEALRLF
jgi:hypothetical protein